MGRCRLPVCQCVSVPFLWSDWKRKSKFSLIFLFSGNISWENIFLLEAMLPRSHICRHLAKMTPTEENPRFTARESGKTSLLGSAEFLPDISRRRFLPCPPSWKFSSKIGLRHFSPLIFMHILYGNRKFHTPYSLCHWKILHYLLFHNPYSSQQKGKFSDPLNFSLKTSHPLKTGYSDLKKTGPSWRSKIWSEFVGCFQVLKLISPKNKSAAARRVGFSFTRYAENKAIFFDLIDKSYTL